MGGLMMTGYRSMKTKSTLGSSLLLVILSVLLSACSGSSGSKDDTSPDVFAFTDEEDVGLAQYVISDAIEIEGINTETAISIEGGEYSIDGGEYTDEEGEVVNGQIVRVRVMSSDELSTETEAVLTVGDEEDTFTVETVDIALSAHAGFKNIIFSWPTVTGAVSYSLLEKADENADFIQKGRTFSSAAVGYTMDVPIHKHDWLGAEYMLQACTNASCSTTEEISLYNYMRRSIGYFKAPNTDEGDQFSVLDISADGRTIAVGAPAEDSGSRGVNQDDGNNSVSGSGAVYVYVKDEDSWRIQAYIKADYPDEGDGFGSSVSLSSDGDTLVVGAPFEDGGDFAVDGEQADNTARDSGAVYVYQRFGDTWFEQNYLKASAGHEGAQFGTRVSISDFGATLAVSAIGDEMPAGANAGAVFVYALTGDNWQAVQKVQPDDAQEGAQFGSALSISANGDRLLVGAEYFTTGTTPAAKTGKAYVFDLENGTWEQTQALIASNPHDGMRFGAAVALAADGARLAVGAPGEKSSGFGVNGEQSDLAAADSGAAYIFANTAAGFVQTTYVKSDNSDPSDRFGSAVAMNATGDTLVVGAIGESSVAQAIHGNVYDNSVTDAGAAYVFTRDAGAWQQWRYVKSPNTDAGDRFGATLALDASADSLIVGAPYEQSDATGLSGSQSNNTANKSGAVYLY